MLVTRDQFGAHKVRIAFHDSAAQRVTSFGGTVAISTFGREQYQWHPATTTFMAHTALAAQMSVIANTKGHADPDGPILHALKAGSTKDRSGRADYEVPAAPIFVLPRKLPQFRNR